MAQSEGRFKRRTCGVFAMQRTDTGEDADIARKASVGTKLTVNTQSLKYKSFTVKDSL